MVLRVLMFEEHPQLETMRGNGTYHPNHSFVTVQMRCKSTSDHQEDHPS